MEKHVTNICRSAYIEIRRISNIRQYLTIDATKTLLCAFVLLKLDYCNSLIIIIIMEICKAPTLRLKALNKHTHIMYIEMENVIKNI